MPGMPERRTDDYVRQGITTLFAALNVATGEVYGSIHRRHRATEFKKFLTKLDNHIPAALDVHLNQVERWFALLTGKRLRRGTHTKRGRIGKRHPQLDQYVEREPKAVRMDQNRRRDRQTGFALQL